MDINVISSHKGGKSMGILEYGSRSNQDKGKGQGKHATDTSNSNGKGKHQNQGPSHPNVQRSVENAAAVVDANTCDWTVRSLIVTGSNNDQQVSVNVSKKRTIQQEHPGHKKTHQESCKQQ